MRKLLLAGVAVAALSLSTPAMAADEGAFVGGTAGGWTGATIGWFLGGPVGAFVGGWTGAAIGASALSDSVEFEGGGSVDVEYELDVGVIVDDDIRLRHIDGEDDYGYFRANGNVYVVDLDSREIVEIRLG